MILCLGAVCNQNDVSAVVPRTSGWLRHDDIGGTYSTKLALDEYPQNNKRSHEWQTTTQQEQMMTITRQKFGRGVTILRAC